MTPEEIKLAKALFEHQRWVDLPSYRTYPYLDPQTQRVHQRYEMASARRGGLVPMFFEEGSENPWSEVLLSLWFREIEKRRQLLDQRNSAGQVDGFRWEIGDTTRLIELEHPRRDWNRGLVTAILDLWSSP